MTNHKQPINLDGLAGRISAVLEWQDEQPQSDFAALTSDSFRGLALVAHPHPLHGGTMDNKVVQTLSRAFTDSGFAVLRWNFRGVGQSEGEHDGGLGETHDMVLLAQWLRKRFPHLPLYAAGFSFGAFVAVNAHHQLSTEEPLKRLVLVGTAAGRFKVDHVPADTVIIHGSQDDTVTLSQVLAWAEPQKLTVHVLAGADHFFHQRLIELRRLVVQALRQDD